MKFLDRLLVESDELYDLGDEGFMNLLEEKINKMSENSEYKKRAEGAKRLLESLKSRRFYKRFHIVPASEQKGADRVDLSAVYSFSKNRFELEEKIGQAKRSSNIHIKALGQEKIFLL